MAEHKIERRHSFTPDEAKGRVSALLDYWKNHYGFSVSWTGEKAQISGHIKGFAIAGDITVEPGRVGCTIDASRLAMMAGKSYVEGKIDEYLDPKKPYAPA